MFFCIIEVWQAGYLVSCVTSYEMLSSISMEFREKEVMTIMMSLFDEEQIMKSFIRSERHDEARETAERMIKDGEMSLEKIARYLPSLSMDELKELEAEVMQLA